CARYRHEYRKTFDFW
nr:immunoglobulin heavy chain junction region [Macaca mulatta]